MRELDAGRLPDNFMVTVCDACLMACCWHGEFMCDKAGGAGTKDLPVAELRRLRRESEDYWSR